jgi:hypothetical protein
MLDLAIVLTATTLTLLLVTLRSAGRAFASRQAATELISRELR